MASRRNLDFLVKPAVLLAMVAAVLLLDRRPASRFETPNAPAVQEKSGVPRLSVAQLRQAVDRCTQKAGTEFRRAWDQGTVSTDAWSETADYASHYNARLDVCFYLVTVVRHLPASETVMLVRQMLFDVNDGELYGEYRGPEAGGAPGAQLPDVCRMTGFYCASRREWDVLAEAFMEPKADSR